MPSGYLYSREYRGSPTFSSWRSLFFLSLIGHFFYQFSDHLRIAQEIVLLKVHFVIKFKNIRNTRWQVQSYNILIGNILQVFDDSPEAIAMCRNQHFALLNKLFRDVIFPIAV